MPTGVSDPALTDPPIAPFPQYREKPGHLTDAEWRETKDGLSQPTSMMHSDARHAQVGTAVSAMIF